MSIRVRFAPSPTGFLHIGGARTALFNWLYARQHQGTFILRIEDTDVERSSQEMVEGILEGLSWLGLNWDEGPYYQSKRLELHRSICDQLLAANKAYRCFCSPQLLKQKKEEKIQSGGVWQYDGCCRELSQAESEDRIQSGQAFAVRFCVPSGQVAFEDAVVGRVMVESENIEDFVIIRSDGLPTYHLSVVADDTDMKISHVIRGADHLANTSKHVLLYQALNQPLPSFVHLPLILGPDKKRLSKRHGATSVLEYRKEGFLAGALTNYLALLGWSPGNEQEFLSREELIRLFDIGRINKSNAVFDLKKLEWMNAQSISRQSAEELEPKVRSVLERESLWDPAWETKDRHRLMQIIDLLKPRIRKPSDFANLGRAFFTEDFQYDPQAVKKYLSFQEPADHDALVEAIGELLQSYQSLEVFDLDTTEKALREIGHRHAVKSGRFIGAVRAALTGKMVAPGIFEVILALGREKSVNRLNRLFEFLQ